MAMGSPLSPIFANIFMEEFERKALASAQFKPKIWWSTSRRCNVSKLLAEPNALCSQLVAIADNRSPRTIMTQQPLSRHRSPTSKGVGNEKSKPRAAAHAMLDRPANTLTLTHLYNPSRPHNLKIWQTIHHFIYDLHPHIFPSPPTA
ncbi:hypothetical protein J6590_012976 [Homalodisca vitripennis]|nr:hypothetical protein J6590_012976 [Homalodisca vitripennis]